jgi:hypothetical protein
MNKKYWTLGLIAIVLIAIIGFFAWDSAENTTAFTIQGYSGDVIGYGNFFLNTTLSNASYSGFINGDFNGTIYDYSTATYQKTPIRVSGRLWGSYLGVVTGDCIDMGCTYIRAQINGNISSGTFTGYKIVKGFSTNLDVPIIYQVFIALVILIYLLKDIIYEWLRTRGTEKGTQFIEYDKLYDMLEVYVLEVLQFGTFNEIKDIVEDNEFEPTQALILVELTNTELVILRWVKKRLYLVRRHVARIDFDKMALAYRETSRMPIFNEAQRKHIKLGPQPSNPQQQQPIQFQNPNTNVGVPEKKTPQQSEFALKRGWTVQRWLE